jgi:hypothetical protein
MSREEVSGLPPPDAKPDPLELALSRLEPAPARLDRDRLMFLAGAESRRSTIRLWQLTAGFLAAVGFASGVAYKAAQTLDPAPITQPATPR